MNLTVELSGTHAHARGEKGHVDFFVFIELQIDGRRHFDEETHVGIGGQFAVLLFVFVEFHRCCELLLQEFPSHQQRLYPCLQFLAVERLGKIGVGTGFYAFDAFLFRYFCRHNDNGNVADNLVGAHLSAHFQSVYLGHHQVGDDEVGHQLLCLLQPFTTV